MKVVDEQNLCQSVFERPPQDFGILITFDTICIGFGSLTPEIIFE